MSKYARLWLTAINKQNILQAVYFGQAQVADSLLPPTSWAYQQNKQTQGYDPAMARQLLAEAGLPAKAFKLDIWAMPVQRLYNPNALKMAELMQAGSGACRYKKRILCPMNGIPSGANYTWTSMTQY